MRATAGWSGICTLEETMAKNDDTNRKSGGERSPGESSGNFKNDPARASEAGRKGGEMSGGNFKNDPQRAAEAGRKGGKA